MSTYSLTTPSPDSAVLAAGLNEATANLQAATAAALSITAQNNVTMITNLNDLPNDNSGDIDVSGIVNLHQLAQTSAEAASANQDEVQDVLDSCILVGTKTKNINQAILYCLFALKCAGDDDKKGLDLDFFTDGTLDKMKEKQQLDLSLPPKKASNNPNFRAYLKKAFEKNDDTVPFPVDMKHFSPRNFILYLTNSRKNGKLLTADGYATKKSCVYHLYRISEVAYPPEVRQLLGQSVAGLKRQKARADQNEGNRIQVGKDSLKQEVYQLVCELLMESEDPTSIFAHFFLTLQWNLIGRSESVTMSHLSHIEIEDDALVLYFAHTKCDQTGLKKDEPWHIYANPLNPAVCAHLAMAKYLLSNSEILKEGGKLFPGMKQYDRYSKFMKRFLRITGRNLRSVTWISASWDLTLHARVQQHMHAAVARHRHPLLRFVCEHVGLLG